MSFTCSVFVRYDQITTKIGCEEQTYILTLKTVEIWRQQGFANCHFTPMWTYENEGDKFFAYYKRLEDENGNNYYISFPPLAFWFAYFVMIPFEIADGKLVLQIINILLHFISALIVYFISKHFLDKSKTTFSPVALTPFLVYLFMPVNMYLHTDIFFPEMISQLFFLLALYYVLKIFKDPVSGVKKFQNYFFLIMFLFVLTEWIALFFFAVLAVVLFRSRKYIIYKKFILVCFLVIGFALTLILLIYGSVNGIQNLAEAMGMRFLERSGFFGEKYSSMGVNIFSISSIKVMFLNIHKALWGWGYIIFFAGIISLFFNKGKLISLIKNNKKILILSSLPVLLYFVVLFNANALHFLLMARLSIPLALFSALVVESIDRAFMQRKLVLLFLSVGLVLSIYFYRKHLTKDVDSFKIDMLANVISERAGDDESVFVITHISCMEAEKYLTFKSKRNIIAVDNIQAADSLMKVLNKENAIVFIQDSIDAEIRPVLIRN